MTTQIILEGDIARTVEIRELSVAPISAILPHLERMAPTVLPILPKGAVSVSFDPQTNQGAVLVERPPRRTEVTIVGDGDRDEDDEFHSDERVYRLALPYQYFLYQFYLHPEQADRPFSLGDTRYFWAKDAVTDDDSLLFTGQMANVDGSGYICWGGTWTNEASLVGNINERTNSFYQTIFNGDLGWNKPREYETYADWEDDSLANPLCWTTWSIWNDHRGRPVRDALRELHYLAETPDTQQINANRPSLWSPQPERFTVARIREHLETLSEPQRRMIRRALGSIERDIATAAEGAAQLADEIATAEVPA